MSLDFEVGYGDPSKTALRAIAAGVVGGNVEDQTRPQDEAVAGVEAVMGAGRDAVAELGRSKGTLAMAVLRAAVGRGVTGRCARLSTFSSSRSCVLPSVSTGSQLIFVLSGMERTREDFMG